MGRRRRWWAEQNTATKITIVCAVVALIGGSTSWIADGITVWGHIQSIWNGYWKKGQPSIEAPKRPADPSKTTPSEQPSPPIEEPRVLKDPVGPGSRCSKPNDEVHALQFRSCVRVDGSQVAFAAKVANLASTPATVTIRISWVRAQLPRESCLPQVVTIPARESVYTDWESCATTRPDEPAAFGPTAQVALGNSLDWKTGVNAPTAHVYPDKAPEDIEFTCGGSARC
jgi:hypothetical protein